MDHLPARLPPAAWDAALAVAVTAAGLVEVWLPLGSATGAGSPVASSVVVTLLGLALAGRRVRPVPSAVAILAITLLAYAFAPVHVQFWGGMVPVMIAVYTVARHGTPAAAWAVAGAALGTLLVPLAVPDRFDPGDVAFLWVNAVIALAVGRALRRTEDAARASALRTRAAEETAERAAVEARHAERTRIAREMHDVVADSVSVMVVQAGAAEAAMDTVPEYTRQALDRIRALGAETLEDLRRVVTVLRADDGREDAHAQPGLAALPDLLDQAAAAGLRAELVVEGDRRPLPAGLDLTAYRIVQEALTNVRRHAGARNASVGLRYGPTALSVEVTDDGPGLTGGVPGGVGHGIAGMRERVALYGGTLHAGPETTGWAVRAVLPWEEG